MIFFCFYHRIKGQLIFLFLLFLLRILIFPGHNYVFLHSSLNKLQIYSSLTSPSALQINLFLLSPSIWEPSGSSILNEEKIPLKKPFSILRNCNSSNANLKRGLKASVLYPWLRYFPLIQIPPSPIH